MTVRLDPENRRRVEALLGGRARRLAVLDQHGVRWPQTFAQLGPVMDNAFVEVRAMVEEGMIQDRDPGDECAPKGKA